MTLKPAVVFAIVLLGLLTLTSATDTSLGLSPAKMRLLARAERALRLTRRQLTCVSGRLDVLSSLSKALSAARHCLYNGLTFSEYRKQRDMCADRSETLDMLRVVRARCIRMPAPSKKRCYARLEQVKRKRKRAVNACKRIGWNGNRNCPKLNPIKDKVKEARAIDCGSDEDVQDLTEREHILEKRVQYLRKMAGAIPSAAPRKQ